MSILVRSEQSTFSLGPYFHLAFIKTNLTTKTLEFPIQVSRDCFVLQWFEDKLGCHGKRQIEKMIYRQ